jgi:hypothetical protein
MGGRSKSGRSPEKLCVTYHLGTAHVDATTLAGSEMRHKSHIVVTYITDHFMVRRYQET